MRRLPPKLHPIALTSKQWRIVRRALIKFDALLAHGEAVEPAPETCVEIAETLCDVEEGMNARGLAVHRRRVRPMRFT